jgi:hypothetical protein
MPNLFKTLTMGAKVCSALMRGPAVATKQARGSILSSAVNIVQRPHARQTLNEAYGQLMRRLGAAGRQTSSGAKSAMAAFYDRFSMDTKYGARGTQRRLKFDGKPMGGLITAPAKAAGRAARQSLSEVRRAVTTFKPTVPRRGEVASTAPHALPEAPPVKELSGPAPVAAVAATLPIEDANVTGQASVSVPPTIKLTRGDFHLGNNGELSPALLQVLNQRRWPTT